MADCPPAPTARRPCAGHTVVRLTALLTVIPTSPIIYPSVRRPGGHSGALREKHGFRLRPCGASHILWNTSAHSTNKGSGWGWAREGGTSRVSDPWGSPLRVFIVPLALGHADGEAALRGFFIVYLSPRLPGGDSRVASRKTWFSLARAARLTAVLAV